MYAMRQIRLMLVMFTVAAIPLVAQTLAPKPDAKAKPAPLDQRIEIQQLKEQLFAVKAQFAQCRASLADATARLDSTDLNAAVTDLNASRAALEPEIRKAGKCKDDAPVDWNKVPAACEPAPAANIESGAKGGAK